jgi:hypothetical protein
MRGVPGALARAASMCWTPSTVVLLRWVMKPRLAWARMYMTAVCRGCRVGGGVEDLLMCVFLCVLICVCSECESQLEAREC